LDPRHFPLLLEGASLGCFPAKQVINKEGEEAKRFYLLCRGKVAIQSFIPGRGPVIIQTIGRGEALGWSWLFPPYQWHFDACALEDTEAIVWDAVQLRAKVAAHRDFGYELVFRLAQVLIQRLYATRMQLLELHENQH
jgi:CRP-like cAMP-binding protein